MKLILSIIKNLINRASIQQSTGVVFDQGLYSVTNFVTGVLLARSLPKEEYGVYVLALSLIVSIMGVQRAIITVPYTVYSQKYGKEDINIYNGSVLMHQILLLIMAIIFSLIFSKYFFLKNGVQTNYLFILLTFSLAVCGVLFRDFVRSYLLAHLAVRKSVILGVSINLIQLIILYIIFVKERLSIHTAFLIVGACSFLPTLYYFFRNSDTKINKSRIFTDFTCNFRIGKWILGSTIIYALSSQSYPWLLMLFANKSSVAILGVLLSLANILGPLLQGVNSYIFPKMAHSRKDGTSSGVMKIMKIATIVLSIIFGFWVVIGILFGNELLTLIYSSKYAGYKPIFIVVIINSFVSSIINPLSFALASLERADINFKSLIRGLIVTISVGIYLIYKFDIYGAVIGMLISNLTTFLLQWIGFLKLLKTTNKEIKNMST